MSGSDMLLIRNQIYHDDSMKALGEAKKMLGI
jgi:hypothetical protein